MKTLSAILAIAIVVTCISSATEARDSAKPGLRPTRDGSAYAEYGLVDPGLRGTYEEAAVDTYCLVWYDFEQYDWQGWTRVDRTAQPGDFFHVDDFAGLSGGSFGRLVPIEGTKSMWCGTRPDVNDDYLCSWYDAPGYGNGWSQRLTTGAIAFTGAVTLSYHIVWDSETGYDYTKVEYDAGNDTWEEVASYDGAGSAAASHVIATAHARTKLRFRFSSDGAWSDQDGLWNSDGGCIVDSITVFDTGGFSSFENFESAAVGAHESGIWLGRPAPGFGNYSGLKNNLTDKDPCGENFGTQIVFFVGSPNPSSSYPGLYDTPFCAGPGGITAPCQFEHVVSPVIDGTKYSTARNEVQDGAIPPGDLPGLGGWYFRFTVYRDIPLANLVFYQWHVHDIVDGCPGQWEDRSFVYYGPDMDYIHSVFELSDLIHGDSVQVSLGVIDMCDVWYLVNGNCAAHTPSPWFDNVAVYRYKTSGPQWYYRDLDFFQDNFPELEFNIESYVRADAANDLRTNDDPVIDPGDSITLDCSSPLGGGIAADPTFGGPAVYIHAKATYVGLDLAKPAQLAGPSLAGSVVTGPTTAPYTINFNYVSDDGVWTVIQCDTARTSGGIQRNRYMIDLNDELFTRGYLIEYYFTALDVAGLESALPRYARSGSPYFEWTCLPTKNSDVLFVDDFTGRGSFAGLAENYWTTVFNAVLPPPNNDVDRYDVNAPSSGVGNGPGSRARNFHLTQNYHTIVWDCGDLPSITITDGSVNSDKSNDCRMLIDWMELSEHGCGLWICGDDVAADLDNLATTTALTLMNTWCGVDFVATSYFDETGGRTAGGVVTPLITGEADAGVFIHAGTSDKFYAYGGCPIINKFDVLEKTAFGKYAASYPVYNATNRYAAIASSQQNPGGFYVNTMWFGFSYMAIRDDVNAAPIDRFELANNVFQWMNNLTNVDVTPSDAPRFTKLAQNYPNPFNPSTTIKFELKEKGFVTLKVYDASGRLVRTLVEGERDAAAHSVDWDGANDRGGAVASGIYFYKMETKGFGQTKKMVLLR
jgi:hypothetical protein